jgi:RNA polymerase sigma factor (sigma-70 family)
VANGTSDADAPKLPTAARAADFVAFLREQRAALAGFLRRRLPTEEDAEDVAQESLMRMLRYRESQPPQAWKPLLYRVASNAAVDHARSRHNHRNSEHVSLDEADLVSQAPQPEQIAEREQALSLLGGAILQLSPRCRQVFLLHRMEGLTYGEIGVRLGISESMVQKYISRAIVALSEVGRAYADDVSPALRQS